MFKNRILFFITFTLFSISVYAQERTITGKVMDALTKQPLGSCSVYSLHSGNGVITDEDGSYTLTVSNKVDSIAISMVGYSALVKALTKELNQIINFQAQRSPGTMQEVSVSGKSKYTRAQRLVRLVIKNKSKHNIYGKDYFTAEVYDKVEFDIKNLAEKIQKNALLKPLRFALENVDSTADKQKYIPAYLSETIGEFYYRNHPEKEKYEYSAIKSSGVGNKSILAYIDALYK